MARDFFFICEEDYDRVNNNEVDLVHPLCSSEAWSSDSVGGAVFIHLPSEFYDDYDPVDWREAYEILKPSLEQFERKYIDAYLNSSQSKAGKTSAAKLTPKQRSERAQQAAKKRWEKR